MAKRYARGEGSAKFSQTNAILDEILDDPAVREGLQEIFDRLSECLANILLGVAKKKRLDAGGLLQEEPIVIYTLKLTKPTNEEIINDLLDAINDLREELKKEDEE